MINPKYGKEGTLSNNGTGEGALDKDAASHDDLMDAFRLSLIFLH
jgi:hypothetical protein